MESTVPILLSTQQIELLRWIGEHEPCSLRQMEKQHAPSYEARRVDNLRKDGWLQWSFGQMTDGGPIYEYRLSDNARAYLEQLAKDEAERAQREAEKQTAEAMRREERIADRDDAERRYRGQNRVTIIASLLGAAFGFALGVIAEHFAGIVSFIARIH